MNQNNDIKVLSKDESNNSPTKAKRNNKIIDLLTYPCTVYTLKSTNKTHKTTKSSSIKLTKKISPSRLVKVDKKSKKTKKCNKENLALPQSQSSPNQRKCNEQSAFTTKINPHLFLVSDKLTNKIYKDKHSNEGSSSNSHHSKNLPKKSSNVSTLRKRKSC